MEGKNKHIELAKKIRELAIKGVGGEKVNAEKMLEDLLKKHNLTIEDIEGENISEYCFNIKKDEVKLFIQIIGRVNHKINKYGEFTAKERKKFKLAGNYLIKSTAAEYVEIESMFSFYSRLYKEELEFFFTAFCKANDLLITTNDNKSTKDLTNKELEDWLRVSSMASKIKSQTHRKQIEK